MWKIHQKLKCQLHNKCIAYTFQQTQLKCILHSSTDKGQKYTRGKQTGLKKIDHILSLPEISLCSDKNRQRRCRTEPKCHHVDCFRTAQHFSATVGAKSSPWKYYWRAELKYKWIWCRLCKRWICMQFR